METASAPEVLEALEKMAKERDAALRKHDELRAQYDEVHEAMLEEHESLRRALADAQGEARKVKALNRALVASLRHVTAALNALLEQVPEVRP